MSNILIDEIRLLRLFIFGDMEHEKISFPEFQEFLRTKSLAKEKYIPFYENWASKFLAFFDGNAIVHTTRAGTSPAPTKIITTIQKKGACSGAPLQSVITGIFRDLLHHVSYLSYCHGTLHDCHPLMHF
jgi:hypothetical protein